MTAPKHRLPWYKRKYLIDPAVQLKVTLLLGGIAVVCAFVICGIAYERLVRVGSLFSNSIVPPTMLPQAFQKLAESLMVRLFAVVGIMILVFILAGIFLTHQLAGPIWKLQIHLKKILNGEEIPPVHFRKHDAFQDLPVLINKLVDNYKKK